MGERYQIHIKVNSERYPKEIDLISIHAQWMWDAHIIRNLNRLFKTLKNTKHKYLYVQEMREYIKGILYVNKSIEGTNYPYRIHLEEEPYKTFKGDSDHGWCVLFLNITKKGIKFKSRFYDRYQKEKTNKDLWKDAEEQVKYEKWDKKDIKNLKKMLNPKFFNNTEEDLQKIFNDCIEKVYKEKAKKIKQKGCVVAPVIKVKSKSEHLAMKRLERELNKINLNVERWK